MDFTELKKAFYIFIIRAQLENKTIDDWFMVVSEVKRSVAFHPPNHYFNKNVVVRAGKEAEINFTLYTSAVMGICEVDAFITSKIGGTGFM